MINLKTLTDPELQQLSSDVLAEQTRRNDLADIPNTVRGLATKFEELGGNKSELVDKINEEPAPAPEIVGEDTALIEQESETPQE